MANDAAPVTLVVGEEELLVERAVRATASAARPAAGDGEDLHDADAGALTVGELSSLMSPSLFGGVGVVIIRSAQNAAKEVCAQLLKYAQAPDPDMTLIVTHPGGAKNKALVTDLTKAGAKVISCPKVTRFSDRADFVRGEFSRAGRKIDEGGVRAMLDSVGSDLRELAAACDQLVSDTEGKISAAVVARYYRGRAEATGFTVADRAVEGRLGESLEQLRWALATGVSPVLISSALAQGVRLLGRVGAARGKPAAALAAEIGAPPWKIDRVKQQLRGWHPDGVARALQAIAEADAQVKGEGSSPAYALERAIRTIVASRAS